MVVNHDGSLRLRDHQPKEESQLEGKIKGDPVKEGVDEDFDYAEKAVHNPVNEPLRVVILSLRLNCLKRLPGRIDEANDGAKRTWV